MDKSNLITSLSDLTPYEKSFIILNRVGRSATEVARKLEVDKATVSVVRRDPTKSKRIWAEFKRLNKRVGLPGV